MHLSQIVATLRRDLRAGGRLSRLHGAGTFGRYAGGATFIGLGLYTALPGSRSK